MPDVRCTSRTWISFSSCGRRPVLQLGRLRVVAGPLRPLDLETYRFELFLELARLLDRVFLLFPLRLQPAAILLEVGQLAVEPVEPLAGGLVLFLAERLALDLELHDAPLDLVELHGHRVDLHPQARRGLVDQVDRLVGQEAVGDVAIRQQRRGHQRGVLQLDAMVDLVALAQTPQDADRVLDTGLANRDRLEAPLERRVLLDVLAVLVERGRADRVQLAAGEQRLEHVRGVERAFGRPRAHDGVELVDEQDDLSFRVDDLLEDRLQTFLELSAVLGAGDKGAHVEPDDLLVLEPFGHVAAHDALGQALNDRRLADARLADEHWVVLGAPRQHLDHATDLFVAADHRVELALLGERRQVAAVAFERLVLVLRVLVGHPLAAADIGERRQDPIRRQAVLLQQAGAGRSAGFAGDGEEQVLGADVLVLQAAGFGLCQIDDQLQARRDGRLRPAVHLWLFADGSARVAGEHGRVELQLAQQGRDHAVVLLDQCDQQMLRLDLLMVE